MLNFGRVHPDFFGGSKETSLLWTCWPCQAYLPAMSFAVWSEWRIPGSSATSKWGISWFRRSSGKTPEVENWIYNICICLFTPKKDPSLPLSNDLLGIPWGIFASPTERSKPMQPTFEQLSMWSTYMAKRERLRSRGSIDKPDPPVETAGCLAVGWWMCLA